LNEEKIIIKKAEC